MSRIRLLIVLLATTSVLLGGVTASRAEGQVEKHSRTGGKTAPDYRNPLTLRLPGDAHAASCADPSVLRAHDPSDRHWYLYCTSDALTGSDTGPDGQPVIHNIPMFGSLDLVHWTYAGDAFATKPSWVKSDAGMWAPDVIYRGGRYRMYYAAQDTNLAGGGSAIGLAISKSPTGPWRDTGTPVVAPTPSTGDPSSPRWEFDPEVVYAGGQGYLYFGSYFGGVYVRELTPDGRATVESSERQIAIDNRYEGTFIVRHGSWYYFMGSATNCCNGPLTGYAVFTARSRSPLGPFVDRSGRSILDSAVGGTPMLVQNGNRWVGTGHNAVLTDYAGQQWIVYHAVDQDEPYYAGDVGYTKRPALLDPLDWKQHWPVVRGGSGPSNRRLPGPAAQPGERTAYRPRFVSIATPGRRLRSVSDSFGTDSLSSQWTWVRPPTGDSYAVTNGKLQWQTQDADLHPESDGSALASVLTEAAPQGDYVVETKVRVNVPRSGCCQNYVQGGLLVYGDDGNYVKLSSVSIWDTRQSEFGKELTPQPAGFPNYGNTVVGPVGRWTYLRIVRRGARYTASTSLTGRHWTHGGTWDADLGPTARIGLVSMGGSGFRTSFAYVRVWSLDERGGRR